MSENPISDGLNMIPYGFYAVTSQHENDKNVMVLNWFSQMSFEPWHVVIGLQQKAHSHKLIEQSKKFAVNIFRKEDVELIKAFSKSREKNPDKFASAKWSAGAVTGIPVLDEAAAVLECEVTEIIDTGSGHSIVVGKVVGGDVRKESEATDTLTLQDIGWSYSG